MAVTKADIVQSIMDQIGFTKNQSSEVTETLLEVIKRTLASGEEVDSSPEGQPFGFVTGAGQVIRKGAVVDG